MRILYYYSSQQFDTGSPKALAGLIDALDRGRHTPLFLASGEGPLVEELERRGVEIVRGSAGEVTYRRPFDALRRIVRCAALLRRLRADVLHVNEFGWNLDIVLGAALARVPVVLHVHNPLTVDRQNLDRLVADRVLFVSEAHRRSTGHPERIAGETGVLYNPVEIERFESGTPIRPELGLASSDVVIATVCQITPNKALDVLLDVARALVPKWPGLRFVIAGRTGRGYEEYAERIYAEAGDPALGGSVRFIGSRSDVPDVLASADIFFLPTRGETFGMVVAEAMAASLPVVTTRVGGIREIVRSPAEGWVLEPDDVPGFIAALDALIGDPERRTAMGAAARASLEGRFDRASFARTLESVYDSL